MFLIVPFARRLLVAGAVLLLASVLLFVVLPGDPVGGWIPARYAAWLGGVLSGDFGWSAHLGRQVADLLAEAVPATVELVLLAMAIAGVLGLAGGVLLFLLRAEGGRAEGREAIAETGTTLVMSVPAFLWALLFIPVFAVALEALPFIGRLDADVAWPVASGFLLLDTLLAGDVAAFLSAVRHMVLPAVALAIAVAPPVMRGLRTALVAVYRSDHVRQARLRGLPPARVLLGHVLGQVTLAMLPVLGVQFRLLLGASLLVEVIFAYPGMGRLMADAVRSGDLPVIQAAAVVYCAVVLAVGSVVGGLAVGMRARQVAG